VQALARGCGLHAPAARVLWARGLRDVSAVRHFLSPRLSDLEDPGRLAGMARSVGRVAAAIRNREAILLFGDYDADGVTSVTLLKKAIELLGHDASYRIPDRFQEGYGLTETAVEEAAAAGTRLLISVDTGIRAAGAARRARELGLDVIITDHHLPEAELPPAFEILNPNQPGCAYPNKSLCGAGVTFKLVQALLKEFRLPAERYAALLDSFLILVAIATVADIVPLTGENRVIVKRGLASLQRTKNAGLKALMKAAGLEPGGPVSSGDVGFRLAPRINAAGRMAHARDAVELFLTRDETRATAIAQELDCLNSERQETEERMVREILAQVEQAPPPGDCRTLIFCGKGWHKGVVGIVASRVAERFCRPALVLAEEPETGLVQGSGRSIPAFHLLDALESMSDLFVRFGGHRQAAGVTLMAERVEEFRRRFEEYARERLQPDDLRPLYKADAELAPAELNEESAAEIFRLQPFGLGHPQPLFLMRGLRAAEPAAVFKEKHLRVKLSAPTGVITAKAWNWAARAGEFAPGARLDALVTIEEDNWSAARGYPGWAIFLKDVRPAQ
jgi:single-stranded-DNA-specific exonuclease